MLTVLTPAPSHDLASLDAVKAEMEITGTADDTVLANLIRQASGTINAYCRRPFGQETVRQVFRQEYGACSSLETLVLDRTPVVSILSVVEDGTTVAPGDYEVHGPSGILRRLSGGYEVNWWARRITVQYIGGYTLPASPPGDIERACVDLVKRFFYSRSRDPALRSEQILDVINQSFTAIGSEQTEDGIPLDIAARLRPHRVM